MTVSSLLNPSRYPFVCGAASGSVSRAPLSGVADSKRATISLWFKVSAGDGTNRIIFSFAGEPSIASLTLTTANVLRLIATDSSAALVVSILGGTAILSGATWHHVGIAFDATAAVGRLMLDGASDAATTAFSSSENVWWSQGNPTFGEGLTGCYAEPYVNTVDYLDISIASNLQRLRTTAGKPAFLGTDGSAVTGAQPIIYLRTDGVEPISRFLVNRGYGGNFDDGGVSACANSPSD